MRVPSHTCRLSARAWLWLVICFSPMAEAAEVIRIAGSSWIADAPTKVADALGLFNAGNARPVVRVDDDYHSGKAALDSLIAGQSEFALAASTPVARALMQEAGTGVERSALAVLGAVALSNRTHVIVANGARGIDEPDDLVGRRVGLLLGTSAHFGWHLFVQYQGLDPTRIELVDIEPVDQPAALERGAIDAAATWEPWAGRVRDVLGDDARQFSIRHLHAVAWLLVTRTEVLARFPGSAERVLTAYRDAIRVINEEPYRAAALLDYPVVAGSASPLEAHGIIWGLWLDWGVVADLEAQFEWLGQWQEAATLSKPSIRGFLHARPLSTVWPAGIGLPPYFFADIEAGR